MPLRKRRYSPTTALTLRQELRAPDPAAATGHGSFDWQSRRAPASQVRVVVGALSAPVHV